MEFDFCEDCGERVYKFGCVNCNEETYIEMQNCGDYDDAQPWLSDEPLDDK